MAKKRSKRTRPSDSSREAQPLEETITGRVRRAVRFMEDGATLSKAAQRAHTTTSSVLKYAGSAIGVRGGHYFVTGPGKLRNVVWFLTPNGKEELDVPSPRTRSAIARHANAARRAMQTGDTRGLRPFRNRSIQVEGKRYPYITDPLTLARIVYAGEFHFEELYVHAV